MGAQQNHTTWTAYLSGTTGTVLVGDVLCLTADGTRYVLSTLANRTAFARPSAVLAITAGDVDNPEVEGQFCGPVPNSITDLGTGAAVPVRISDEGRLERVASPTSGDEVVGHCDADGVAYLNFATVNFATIARAIAPTGTGFVTCTSGVIDSAATANIRYSGGKLQTDGNVQWKNSTITGDLAWTPTSSSKTLTLPDATDTLVGKATTDSLSNKTLVLPKIADASTHNYIFAVSTLAADRTVTLPLLTGNDTLVFATFAATLLNKTLDSPVITGTPIYQGTRVAIKSVVGEVQTSSTSQTTVASYAMSDETHVQFDAIVTYARRTNVTKAATYKRSVAYRRTSAGAPTIVGTIDPGTDQETTPADDVTFDVSTNTVRVRVTAADTDGRNWSCELRLQETTAA